MAELTPTVVVGIERIDTPTRPFDLAGQFTIAPMCIAMRRAVRLLLRESEQRLNRRNPHSMTFSPKRCTIFSQRGNYFDNGSSPTHNWYKTREARKGIGAPGYAMLFERRCLRAATICLGILWSSSVVAVPAHPLDPLDADELSIVKNVLLSSGRFSADTNFAWIELDEPPKTLVRGFKSGSEFPRRAAGDAIDYANHKNYHFIVDIGARRIASLVDLGDLQPGINATDTERARAIVDADPRIKKALMRRGMAIPGNVSKSVPLHYVSVGIENNLDHSHGRLVRILFEADQKAASHTGPLLEGLTVVVDLFTKRVIRFEDFGSGKATPVLHDLFDTTIRGNNTALDAKPEGTMPPADILIHGHLLKWRNWQLRFGFNLREGLVLYQIGFVDRGRLRSILYRASISEVLTSYGDPSASWRWMHFFDEGSFGLGYVSIPVTAGREVPTDALTLSPLMPEPDDPQFSETYSKRVYIYERDGGTLLHYEQNGRTVYARSRNLVIGWTASLDNYLYSFNWVFKMDGSFAFEVELNGVVRTKFVGSALCETCRSDAQRSAAAGAAAVYVDRYGSVVAPGLIGIDHQHWFALRLDFDIDGVDNAVMENNLARSAPAHRSQNPTMTVRHTIFSQAERARRETDDESARTWTIYNPSAKEPYPVGYTIEPGENTTSIFAQSRAREAIGFSTHNLWVTPYRDGQFFAAGRYPGQSKGNDRDSLAAYSDRSRIYDRDIVVWYALGESHVPRPEDFPLMSTARKSVTFVPDGFFGLNPALARSVDSGPSAKAER